ncbi:MAG: hypothetical protein ISS47_03985 [Candidatus Omnitrophica bacterium]|nr:hypothetical protein [Candidatus Omnitrophota bacterium]
MKQRYTDRGRYFAIILIVCIVVAICLVDFIYFGLHVIMFPLELDNGEGITLNEALRLAGGLEIYKPINTPPYIQVCYPPFFLWVVSKITIHNVDRLYFSGRLLSFCSSIAILFLLLAIVIRFTKSFLIGLIAVGLYAGAPFIREWSPLLRVDMFGIFWMFFALCIYILFKDRHGIAKGVFVFPLLLGIYTKHTLLSIPLAILADIVVSRDKKAFFWYLGFLLSGLFVFLFINLRTDGNFYRHIVLYSILPWDQGFFAELTKKFLLFHLLPLALVSVYFYPSLGLFKKYRIITFYIIFSLFELFMGGRLGTNINFSFNLIIALIIAICLTIAHITGRIFSLSRLNGEQSSLVYKQLFVRFYAGLIIFYVIYTLYIFGMHPKLMRDKFRSSIKSANMINRIIRKTDGKILTEEAQWALFNNREFYYDTFGMSMLARVKKWDQDSFVREINNREFGIILLLYDLDEVLDPERPSASQKLRFTEEMLRAIHNNYRLLREIEELYLYVPRD